MIKHPAPVAYCLPGGARSVTVLSDGLMGLLSEDELRAVLVHERAHLSQRHHLLLWAFAAWRSALPWLPTSRLAQRSVNELIEMLADDEAVKEVDQETLVGAIAIVATGSHGPSVSHGRSGETPDHALTDAAAAQDPEQDDASLSTVHRLRRLLEPQAPLTPAQTFAALATSALLLTVPTALLIAPGFLG